LECAPSRPDYHGLCKYVWTPRLVAITIKPATLSSPTALWRNIFLLLLTAAAKFLLTSWTFGMMVGAVMTFIRPIYSQARSNKHP
jgi:chloride channel 3/4/5